MSNLEYIGAGVVENLDVSIRSYVVSKMANNLSSGQIDDTLNGIFAPYAAKSYVDSRDALNATQAYIQQQDNLRLKLAQKDSPNGIAALDANGKVNQQRINLPITQKYPRAFWSPDAYHASPVLLSTSTETAVYTCNITDPGYDYKVVVFGRLDGLSAVDGMYPIVSVRVGGVSGNVIAQGRGISDSYNYYGIDDFERNTTNGMGGPDFWTETILSGSAGFGRCNGTDAVWGKSGTSPREIDYRRTGPDAVTFDDWQEINWLCTDGAENTTVVAASPCRHRIVGRRNEARTKYVALVTEGATSTGPYLSAVSARFVYANGGAEANLGGPIGFNLLPNDLMTTRFGTASGKRWFQLLRNGSNLLHVEDTGGVTAMGSDARGWGFGYRAGYVETFGVPSGQVAPPSMGFMTINDLPADADGSSYGMVNIIPTGLHNQLVNTGSKTLTVSLNRSSTAGAVAASTYHPELYVAVVKA